MSYQVPQTRIFTQFEASNAITTSALAACVVAPYYDVHADVPFGPYNHAQVDFPYIGLSGNDRITSEDVSDGVFSTIIKNAQVKGYNPITCQTSTPGAAGYLGSDKRSLATGLVVADGGGFPVPAGFPALKVGHPVVQAGSNGTVKGTFKIAGFLQGNADSYGIGLPTFETTGAHSTGDVAINGSHTLSYNTVLTIRITTGGTVTSEDSPVRATIALGDAAPVISGFVCGTTATALTGISSNLTLQFTADRAWVEGDIIRIGLSTTMTATYQYDQGYSVVVLDADATATAGDLFTLYYSAGDIVNPSGATWGDNGLSLAASLNKGGLDIYSGDVYGTYRIRKDEFNKRVYSVSTVSELEGLVGKVHPLNPLSIMVYLALINGANVNTCFVAVSDDSYDAYSDAFDIIGSSTEAWAIVPYSEDTAIQQLAYNKAQEYCGAAIMNWKTAWLGYDVADIETIISALAGTIGEDGDTTSAYLYTGSANITTVKYGDIVTINGVDYLARSVNTATDEPYILLNAELPAGDVSNVKITRKVSAQDKVAAYRAAARSFNSELVRLFFADDPYLVNWPEAECPMSYLAAAWAGKRSGVAPHQGLTRSTISGIACRNTTGFTADLLNQMAEYGVWITVTSNTEGITYCRHQLTTKDSTENYSLKEDSKVSNAHEICMTFRAGLANYYGRANTTESALEVIRLRADTICTTIISRPWSDLLGPQVTAVNSITIERDPSYNDRVNLYVSMATPDPLNNLDVYLTIS